MVRYVRRKGSEARLEPTVNERLLLAVLRRSIIADSNNLILIEWPENVKEALLGLKNYSQISFSMLDSIEISKTIDTTRIITEDGFSEQDASHP